jgi:negative regulator of sigma E activity
VVTQSLGNKSGQVTIIGGLPLPTAQKLAESVEPIIF